MAAASLTQLLALALVAFVCNLAAGQQLEGPLSCDSRTEVWNPKCNAHCEPTCTEGDLVPCSRAGGSGGPPQGRFNERICRPKCNCKPGLIRATRDGPCVPRDQCGSANGEGSQCKRNEEFRSCGSACPAVCGQKAPEACTAQCVPGCFCARGYIRDKNGLCIPTSACRAGRHGRPGRQRNIISNQHPPTHFF
ncbi:hypothetical protein HPB50_014714 [Hyalomma asiaticum]|uniref:Uncharacterized protein n=1 Tax=Hyalomma asiaticum TaxID=266040 RepID=A0ACB7RNQ6_HYAAI|nr:hypothetical protein HPB50_014714 [Hyalomma asiaticum]